jgi:hypothetical protein
LPLKTRKIRLWARGSFIFCKNKIKVLSIEMEGEHTSTGLDPDMVAIPSKYFL